MSLHDARDMLERSKKRRDDAERAGDLTTSADLTYYVIPNLMRLVEQFEKDEANSQKDVATRDRLLKEIDESKTKLEQLRTRMDEAERARDITMVSDLKYYAIPDVQARIQKMEEELA